MYRSLVGKLLYLTHSRLDICFSVSYLSRFLNSPSNVHFTIAKRVVRYIAGTRNYGLWYSQGDGGKLEAYSDSNWGGSISDCKSSSGVLLGLGSSVVSWNSKKQEIVALSTIEAEYIAATSATCQIVWFRRVLQECGVQIKGATPL
ncbi:secreted RxLR effector protein 161-like [Dioscorea cayenensis subsp. rotundata]|uniref:Secreted RxLR effector protein 161-like n=1 Tax=Dioscorea cayennensis subsp. rotundata TaxID=55577 RepID=A0AB40C262_DIOCR|nr:secreted RxLR effector protein 161-like [Dioscorea cayenensis subsp. rotundata]